jgi:epoxyqueuosine reductase
MTPAEQTAWTCERARLLGFDLCGVAPVDGGPRAQGFKELRYLPEWLARGYAGEMKYLHDLRRQDPRSVLGGARSLIVVALNYHSQPKQDFPNDSPPDRPRGWISRYAWGDDYHQVIEQRLGALIGQMRAEFAEGFEARSYTDTGPIIERVAAKYAGLGWLGKNTCLINGKLGSWIFLGVIVTTLELAPSLAPGVAPPADLCGTCTRCLDACPTQAFPEPYVLDARRCISYLTIELRGAIPEEFREHLGGAVVGCDICQDVCPWNRKAPVTSLPAFEPRRVFEIPGAYSGLPTPGHAGFAEGETVPDARQTSLLAPDLEWLASLSQQEFSVVFRGSAVKRVKWQGLVRNACVALGNSSLPPGSPAFRRVVELLQRLSLTEDQVIADHARWALDRLSDPARPIPGAG